MSDGNGNAEKRSGDQHVQAGATTGRLQPITVRKSYEAQAQSQQFSTDQAARATQRDSNNPPPNRRK